jgi:hypothetical protein
MADRGASACAQLNSHYDVVPCVLSMWNHDPWAAELKDGEIIGSASRANCCDTRWLLLSSFAASDTAAHAHAPQAWHAGHEVRLHAVHRGAGPAPRRRPQAAAHGAPLLHAGRGAQLRVRVPARARHALRSCGAQEIGGRDGMGYFVKSAEFKALAVGMALGTGPGSGSRSGRVTLRRTLPASDEGLANANPSGEFTLFYGERAVWWLKVRPLSAPLSSQGRSCTSVGRSVPKAPPATPAASSRGRPCRSLLTPSTTS